jgi:hypothetical protein
MFLNPLEASLGFRMPNSGHLEMQRLLAKVEQVGCCFDTTSAVEAQTPKETSEEEFLRKLDKLAEEATKLNFAQNRAITPDDQKHKPSSPHLSLAQTSNSNLDLPYLALARSDFAKVNRKQRACVKPTAQVK